MFIRGREAERERKESSHVKSDMKICLELPCKQTKMQMQTQKATQKVQQ